MMLCFECLGSRGNFFPPVLPFLSLILPQRLKHRQSVQWDIISLQNGAHLATDNRNSHAKDSQHKSQCKFSARIAVQVSAASFSFSSHRLLQDHSRRWSRKSKNTAANENERDKPHRHLLFEFHAIKD